MTNQVIVRKWYIVSTNDIATTFQLPWNPAFATNCDSWSFSRFPFLLATREFRTNHRAAVATRSARNSRNPCWKIGGNDGNRTHRRGFYSGGKERLDRRNFFLYGVFIDNFSVIFTTAVVLYGTRAQCIHTRTHTTPVIKSRSVMIRYLKRRRRRQ